MPPAPPPPPVPAGHHIVAVRPGDTLWGLARRHWHDPFSWPELYRANGALLDDPDLIRPGQQLVVPDRPPRRHRPRSRPTSADARPVGRLEE